MVSHQKSRNQDTIRFLGNGNFVFVSIAILFTELSFLYWCDGTRDIYIWGEVGLIQLKLYYFKSIYKVPWKLKIIYLLFNLVRTGILHNKCYFSLVTSLVCWTFMQIVFMLCNSRHVSPLYLCLLFCLPMFRVSLFFAAPCCGRVWKGLKGGSRPLYHAKDMARVLNWHVI